MKTKYTIIDDIQNIVFFGVVTLLVWGFSHGPLENIFHSFFLKETTGTVLKTEAISDSGGYIGNGIFISGVSFIPNVEFSYTVNGVSFTTRRALDQGLVFGGSQETAEEQLKSIAPGTKLSVWYSTLSPGRAYLNSHIPLSTTFIAVLVLCSYLWFISERSGT